jgi:hypothetical protein
VIDEPEPILSARAAVKRSESSSRGGAETVALRDALRALIDFASILNTRLQAVEAETHGHNPLGTIRGGS